MYPIRREIELQGGVKAAMLFTPHLFSYRGRWGLTFEMAEGDDTALLEYYADIFFAAAVNAWEIDEGHSTDDLPFRRGDFHGLIVGAPGEFGRCIRFALEALTGKGADDLAKEPAADGNKKKRPPRTMRR